MTPRLDILVGADVPPDPNSGAAGTVWHTNRALRELGHVVDDFWSSDMPRRIHHGNLHYLLELPRRYETIVQKRCTAHSYDVIQLSQPHAWRAARYCRRSGYRGVFVNRSHGVENMVDDVMAALPSFPSKASQPLWRQAASHLLQSLLARHFIRAVQYSDGFVVGAQDNADYLIHRLGAHPACVLVASHGVDDVFLDTPRPPLTAERMHRLLHVGNLVAFKAPLVLADAVSRCLRDDPALVFTWVLRREDHETARRLFSSDLRARVQFVPTMDRQALRSEYDRHGVFLFPSWFEGFGKAPLEAMARGLCVVATPIGGMRDIIVHDHSGVLVPPGAADRMTHEVISLIRNPARAQALGDAAAQRASEFTWKRCAGLCADFYATLLERKRGQPS